MKDVGYDIKETILLPDEQEKLEKELIRLADQRQINVIFTTGGTGFSERDRTPEATVNVCDRMANGIAEAIRNYSMTITKRAMFSRAVSGIRKKTLIINLPGSPKAVQEALEFLLLELGHGLGILRGTEGECARNKEVKIMSGFTHFNEDGNAVMVDVGKRLRQKEKHLHQGDPHVGRMLSESKGRQHEKRRCSWRSKNCRDYGCKKDSRTDSAVPSVKPYQSRD